MGGDGDAFRSTGVRVVRGGSRVRRVKTRNQYYLGDLGLL